MSKKDKFYTSEELTGYDLNDRLYSESEVSQINDLFEEFFDEYSDFYEGDVDTAYNDFFDAYSASGIKDLTPKDHRMGAQPKKSDKRNTRIAATAGGAALGAGVGSMLSMKDKSKRKALVAKVSSGTANKQDLKELSNLNKRIKVKTIGGAVTGGALSYGAVRLASKINTK